MLYRWASVGVFSVLLLSACARGGAGTGAELATEAEHEHQQAELGEVEFPISCDDEAREAFETGLAQLHHMMYEHALPQFQAAAEADSECAMAHWGIAMASFQPLWHPTRDEDMARGKAAIDAAQRIGAPTARERGYIAAARAFFTDPEPPAPDRPTDHERRIEAWKAAQRELHERYPEDVDAAALYALSEVAYAMTQFSPEEEHDYARERRAGALLERYFEDHPEHPGLYHYLIHAYDSPELAHRAEAVARAYDELAPETTHALHMPSHILVRLGEWEETAELNERAAEAALHHPVNGRVSIHYPHALDYMMYAYLQLGESEAARETLEAVWDIDAAQPDFASAYGLAAPQARYVLEQRLWEEAAGLEPGIPEALDWEAFPAAEALFHYARGLGAARTGDLEQADAERENIEARVAALRAEGDLYWAYMTEALADAVGAWVLYERGRADEAVALMEEAADLEESMDKHPITPGEVLPVRELYGELLLLEGRAEEAHAAFQASLERTPNRRLALIGAERAADAASGELGGSP